MDTTALRARLEQIATALREINPSETAIDVLLGCGDPDVTDALGTIGAPLNTSYYNNDTAIDSREITIGRVRFHAQNDTRPMTATDHAAVEAKRAREERREALRKELAALDEQAVA